VLVQEALDARGALVLGHGAGGSVSAPDLQVATRVALEEDWSVALVEQPYRVAGRTNAPRAPKLDEAWLAVMGDLTEFAGLPVVAGGRSS
jgi:predicted alpha/beta-hydrolase family hydrolase